MIEDNICALKISAMRKAILSPQEFECRSCLGYDEKCKYYIPFDRNANAKATPDYKLPNKLD